MRTNANGVGIHYEIEGVQGGPAVTLSHSLGACLEMWEPQVEAFGDRYRLVRYDSRGHGRSAAPAPPYTLEAMADDLRAVLDDAGVERTAFVGISMGGMIGQTFALRYPDRLWALVLCDTTSEVPEAMKPMWDERIRITHQQGMAPHVEPTVERWLTQQTRSAHPDKADTIRRWVAATASNGYIGCCHAIRELSLTDALRKIEVPTLVVVGAEDSATPPEVAERIHERIEGSRMEVIEDAAHLSSFERPAELNRIVGGFLAEHAG